MMTANFRTASAHLILNFIKTGEDLRRDMDPEAAEILSKLEEAGMSGGMNLSDSIGAIRYMPEEERLDLLSDMWTLAAGDEDIVDDADLFILSAAEALDLPISTVEIVRPAMFANIASDIEKTVAYG